MKTRPHREIERNHRKKNKLYLRLIKHWRNSPCRMLVFAVLALDVRVFTDKTFEINSRKTPY